MKVRSLFPCWRGAWRGAWLVAAVVVVSPSARADLVVPEVANCRGHKVGDACDGGTCTSDGFDCLPGACRRFSDEQQCKKEGCTWAEVLRCTASTAGSRSTAAPAPGLPPDAVTPPSASPAIPPPSDAPASPPPASTAPAPDTSASSSSSCASLPAGCVGPLLFSLLLLFRRRR